MIFVANNLMMFWWIFVFCVKRTIPWETSRAPIQISMMDSPGELVRMSPLICGGHRFCRRRHGHHAYICNRSGASQHNHLKLAINNTGLRHRFGIACTSHLMPMNNLLCWIEIDDFVREMPFVTFGFEIDINWNLPLSRSVDNVAIYWSVKCWAPFYQHDDLGSSDFTGKSSIFSTKSRLIFRKAQSCKSYIRVTLL